MTRTALVVILLIITSCISAFAQKSDLLKNDLGNSFTNASVVRLNTRDVIRRAKASQTLSIATSNKAFELSLIPRDLRASRYYAEDMTAVGLRRLEKTDSTTYKGKVVGDTESQVRLTIDESGIEGFFGSNRERFFIEPAKKYSEFAAADEFVVYRAEDVLRDKNINCPQDLTEEIADRKDTVLSNAVQTISGVKTIEMATEADFEFVNSAGGAAGANSKALSILNMVEGLYESELSLTLSVVYQHTWSTQDSFETGTPRVDPNCTGSTIGRILCNFQDYWNTNHPATQVPRDAAHLFSYKASIRAQGFAFVGVICRNANFAYGVSGRVDTGWGWEEANFLITAHELGHNLGANHSDTMANCGNTLMNAQLSGSTQFSFCTASRSEVGGYVTTNGTCMASRSLGYLDFDGDGKTDIGIFRPSVGEWWVNRSSTGQTFAAQFGTGTDKVASGDFTGDGKADVAIFRPSNGNWFILRSEDSSFFSFPFGTNGDIPAPADYDADGKTDAAVFRPSDSTWYIRRSSDFGFSIVTFGTATDKPVPADYDGDGKADIAIFRPADGSWWYLRSSDLQFRVYRFGVSTDKPVQGDYTGDGKADIAVWRPATGEWFVQRSEDNSFYSVPFGQAGDVPAPGDYDGDGKFDSSIFRPSSSTWYINRTTAGIVIATFGSAGDNPVPNAFVP
jgi:hypothetical protein